MKTVHSIRKSVAFLAVFALAAGCSTTRYRESADKEAYSILANKTPGVQGMIEDVNIDSHGVPSLEGLPVNETLVEFLGTEAQSEVGAYILSLEKALEIAYTYSREYQTEKERLFLQALSLSLDRHQFTPIFSGGVTGFTEGSTRLETPVESGVSGDAGASLLLKGGGRIALNLSATFLHLLKGNSGESAFSVLSGSFSQPLWRGAGRKVAAENLTQAERDMIYAMRSFTRTRKEFTVRVASSYYEVLQRRDAVINTYAGLQSQRVNLVREQAFVDEGLEGKTQADASRLTQNVLNLESSLIRSIVGYKRSLDSFKILLGLRTLDSVILDDTELTVLRDMGITPVGLDAGQAIEIALSDRLDLLTSRDGVDDAERQIAIAANNLKPDLDFLLSSNVPSKPGNNPSRLDFDSGVWDASLDVGLPLDRKAERNNYRRALINFEVAKRSLDLFEDDIRLDVRDKLRGLEQLARDYEISKNSIDISELRVEQEQIFSELGRGLALNLVDAQNALTSAQTDLTGVLVDHTIALLELWRDIGILNIDENGLWEDATNG